MHSSVYNNRWLVSQTLAQRVCVLIPFSTITVVSLVVDEDYPATGVIGQSVGRSSRDVQLSTGVASASKQAGPFTVGALVAGHPREVAGLPRLLAACRVATIVLFPRRRMTELVCFRDCFVCTLGTWKEERDPV